MKTKISSILVFLLVGHGIANSQSLKIVYDFGNDQFRYYHIKPGELQGKEIGSPIVGRNKLITVEVVNFNKFVYVANAEYTSTSFSTQNDQSFLEIISPLVNPVGAASFFTSLGGILPSEIGRGGVLSTRGAATAYDDVVDAYNSLTEIETNMKNMDYAINKLNKLKYNSYLPTDTIVHLSDFIVSQLFKKPVVTPSDFSALAVKFNTMYNSSMASLNSSVSSFLAEYEAYASERGEDFEGRGLDASVRNFRSTAQEISQSFNTEYITEKIDFLEMIYTSIKSTKFNFRSSHLAADDMIDLDLSFYKLPNPESVENEVLGDLNNLSDLPKIKSKKINITVRGDMKIKTGIGLAFPSYQSRDQFINRDSIIMSQDRGSYSPNLAGYVSFYPYTGRIVNLGGTFGVGVPLNDDKRTVNMYMGGSLLLGSNSRVAIHGGFSLGQVEKLDNGYTIGDKLQSEFDEVPTRNIWEWGNFIGISFDIGQ
ncbi:MAG: hypothetical protein H6607_07985 [Flavobacteriales bacterium]|nr:hypothetical protein [Flavobacteriales bacterium]